VDERVSGLGPLNALPAFLITAVALLMVVAVRWRVPVVLYERYSLGLFFACVALNSLTAGLFYLGFINDDVRSFCAAAARAAASIVGVYLSSRWWRARQRREKERA
jgi:hypothetical protein